MWVFCISKGELSKGGALIGKGYSGFGNAANDPRRVKEKMVGPIPPGSYRIGTAYKHEKLGPVCMNLDPMPKTDTFGRSLFRVHGDNKTPAPHDGSHGCIILPRPIRERINFSDDKILEVVP